MRKKLAIALAMAALMAPVAPVAAASAPRVGERAPDFELTLFDGSKVHLADLKGQVVILNFWATWCVPCRTELPTLDTYYRVRQPNGLRVFAVTTEDSLPVYQLKPLFAKMAIPAVRKLKGPYATLGGVPTNYIIDRNGVIRFAKAAAFDLDDLNRILVPLLNERASQDARAHPLIASARRRLAVRGLPSIPGTRHRRSRRS